MNDLERAEVGRFSGISVSTLASIYGCCGLIDPCSDNDLMSLSFAGREPFLDALAWELTNVCKVEKTFFSYVRAATYQGGASAGYLADPCADGNGVEFGTCKFRLEDFGLLRRMSPVRNVTRIGLKLCDNQPRYRLDGTVITNDLEFDMRLTTEGIMQDLKRMVISGNGATPGQFDGLEQLIVSNYHDPDGTRCTAMDANVLDWNHNTMAGGSGVTWNGRSIGSTYGLVDVLLALFQKIRQRIAAAPALGRPRPGDIVLMMPTFLTRCLLDQYTCWSVCAESVIETFEARRFRESLNGGLFGAGTITLDGFEIPLIAYDWGTIKSPTQGDIYMLTLQSGGVRTVTGQLNDMRLVPSEPGAPFGYTDGGRLLTWAERDNTCLRRQVEMQPRLLMWAPWAQARIQNVRCNPLGGVLSPDPWETSYFPETSVEPATCPGAETQEAV